MSVEDHLRSDRLAAPRLVEMDFSEGVYRIWEGGGELTTLDGRVWQGMGPLLEVSALESGSDLSAEAFTIALSRAVDGVEVDPAAFAAAVNAERRRDVYGRPVNIYRQVMDIDTAACIEAPVTESAGIMSHITTSRQGPTTMSITLHCEGILAEGHKAPHGRYTDADQQARHPGDRGLEFVAANSDRVLIWPRD